METTVWALGFRVPGLGFRACKVEDLASWGRTGQKEKVICAIVKTP